MSDQAQGKQQPNPNPFITQFNDPKFSAMSFDDQQNERASLFLSRMKGTPAWESAPDDQKVRVLKQARDMFPPSFTDIKYEGLRQSLERPDNQGAKFLYTTDTQMGMTGLATRGVVNTARAFSNTLSNIESRVGQFFGAKPQGPQQDDETTLLVRAIGGDKDGVKLAQYLQKKYERPFLPNLPLVGGQTPTQLLGSALGFGTDLLTMSGPAKLGEEALVGATKGLPVVGQTLAKLFGRAAISGTAGVVRGELAGAANTLSPNKAPIEGAVDTSHGIAATVKSVGDLWGMWAAQDLAFGMLGQGAAEGLSRVGKTYIRAVTGRGGAALPHEAMFEKTTGGEYTPVAQDLQRRFLAGNLTPEVRSQLGPAARDYAQSYAETLDYSLQDPKALLDNPIAAWRVANQHMMSGKNTPLGIATVEDGVGTWRLRSGLAKGGAVLGEHLSFPEAEMVTNGKWQEAIDTARDNYSKWNAKYEKTGGKEDLRQMQSSQLRMNALQDAFPHDRAIRDSLTIIEGNLNRLAPEGAAKLPSKGAMLSYGEVGDLQGLNMKVAKTNISLSDKELSDVGKRGSLINSDSPTRFAPAPAGDYNAAIVYSRAASESVYQVSLARAQEYIRSGAKASPEQLAQWKLRDDGFDAIQHSDGSVTALYPRQQVKHVSDFVNKSSREYTSPELKPMAPRPEAEQLSRLLAKARAVHGEDIKPPATIKSWSGALKDQNGETTLWYNDSKGGTHALSEPNTIESVYKSPSMLGGETDKFNWLTEASNREANTRIAKLPDGQYQLHMYGMDQVITGDLNTVTDVFLTRATTTAHLRASLDAEGMDLKKEGDQYSIIGRDGTVLGTGSSLSEVMVNSKYRPKLIDGRFGPANVEVLPDGSRFEYSPQGIRGSLSDVYKYANQFMDVSAEEGKSAVGRTDSGGISLGHDGAYTVEIPSWGIREKFDSSKEAHDYLNGKYKEYDNIQRLANERGFTFDYDAKRGFVLSNASGTFQARTIDDVGKVLARVPDPRWAPGGQFNSGTTFKASADAIKLASDTAPSYGKYWDRSDVGKAVSRARTWVSDILMPARASIARAEHVYGLKGLSQTFSKAGESLKTAANQSFLDAQKVLSISRMYDFNGQDTVIVDKVMQALGQEDRETVLEDFGIKEGSAKRGAILDAAERLRTEFYNKVYTRSGQDPDIFLKDYARKVSEYKQREPERYKEMEMQGPAGMRSLITTLYGGRVPDGLGFQALHERVADMDGILKEQNAFSKAILYAQKANQWTYAAENMKALAERLHGKDIPDHVQKLGEHFIDEALNAGQSDAREILRALGNEGSQASHRGLVSYLQTSAAMGTYGFRPSSALTILEHSYLLGTGYLGTEAMNRGFEISAKGGLPHLQEQFQKGVFTGRIPVLYGFGDASMGSNWLTSMFTKLGKASSYFVQNGHILGRSAVYDSASWLFDRNIKPWVDGGKLGDWDSKLHSVKGYMLDQGVVDQVESLLSKGDYAGAKHAYAQNMTDQIAFAFRPEDQGLALNSGMVAKMYGQLMVVPTHYASAMTRLSGRGSFADRIANLATFGKNTAAFYGANRLAGLSGANLLPWRVVTLRGGPLWQNMTNLTSQQPGSNQLKATEKALAALTPGIPQVVQATQVVKELQAGHPWAAFLTLNGFSVRPDLKPPKR
jgi:hypothetical protein